jgi:hypothetical protein
LFPRRPVDFPELHASFFDKCRYFVHFKAFLKSLRGLFYISIIYSLTNYVKPDILPGSVYPFVIRRRVMKIWLTNHPGATTNINFSPETPEEAEQLDQMLKFTGEDVPIFDKIDSPPGCTNESKARAVIGGHEKQRWISILPG